MVHVVPNLVASPRLMSSIFLVILAAIVITDILWWVHSDRLARAQPHAPAWRLSIALFMSFQLGMVFWMLGTRLLSLPDSYRPPQIFNTITYIWHLLVLPTTLVLLVAGKRVDMILARLKKCKAKPDFSESKNNEMFAAVSSRRQFLSMMTLATPPLITGLGVGLSLKQIQNFRIRPLEVRIPSLPAALDGMKIAVVADLHVGTYTEGAVLKRIVDETSRLNADLVLLPGDLINNTLTDLSGALEAVSNIQSRHGCYLCLGNHDLIENGSEFIRQTKAKLPLLVAESKLLSVRGCPVEILGLPWLWKEDAVNLAVSSLARGVSAGAFPILMSHHPHAFDAAASAGLPLTVSGHTHGGQLMVSESAGFGPLLFRYWSGLYQKPQGDSALVVSNGAGHWFPLRVGAPAEIVDLTLRRSA